MAEALWFNHTQPTKVDEASTDRSVQLLRSWLTPAQLEQFEKDQSFEVVGNATGTRYRVEKGFNYNIYALSEDGRAREILCCVPVIPDGHNPYYVKPMPIGDVMLAQKMALETDEALVLEVANKRSTYVDPPVDVVGLNQQE